jgi:hypothetical protein
VTARERYEAIHPYTVALETEVATLRSLIQMERQQAEQRVQEVERERDAKLQQAEQALAAAREECERLTWCANELMRHGRDYQRKRAGYADFWPLIWNDVLDAYAAHTEEAGDDVG